MSPVDDNDRGPDPGEQATEQGEPDGACGPADRPGVLSQPYGLACDEPGSVPGEVVGHCWHGWRRLADAEDYLAVCSCGWRSTTTSEVSPMLYQVKEHLDGGRPSARAAQPPAGGEDEASRRVIRPAERARELHAAAGQQEERLSQALERSGDLLSASQEQADRLVTALASTAANLAPERLQAVAPRRLPEALQRQLERARQLRAGIVSSAAALAVIAEELALVNQNKPARPPVRLAEVRRLIDAGGTRAPRIGPPWADAAEHADPDRDLLDGIVRRLFLIGLSLQSAADPSHAVAVQSIADALRGLDATIREIRDHVFAARSHNRPAGPATRNGPG